MEKYRMKTPYVKISTIRKLGEWETILGYRPSLVITNNLTQMGNKQTVWMGVIGPLNAKIYNTPEEAQDAYDNGIPAEFELMFNYPEFQTNELNQINRQGLWRRI